MIGTCQHFLKKAKPTAKPKKDTKNKDFDFCLKPTQDNYVSLLKTLLKECNAVKFDAMTKKQFCIKCGTKKVWLDLEEVKRVYKMENGNSIMSKKDEELVHLHGKLEKRRGNNSDSSDTYLDPITGSHYPLMPFLMDEWV
ncbi:hypothetical protein L208DRAFT_1382349 [Tricholoma matsutake]|nr:hypothetical protein L208DRAFT_1382349 [Tricholoma matsutake 945]